MIRLGKKLGTLLDLCVSSLRRGHANLLCVVPILSDDPLKGIHWLCSAVILTVAGALHTAKQSQIPADCTFVADGHISPNAPDLFRPPKLSGEEPA